MTSPIPTALIIKLAILKDGIRDDPLADIARDLKI